MQNRGFAVAIIKIGMSSNQPFFEFMLCMVLLTKFLCLSFWSCCALGNIVLYTASLFHIFIYIIEVWVVYFLLFVVPCMMHPLMCKIWKFCKLVYLLLRCYVFVVCCLPWNYYSGFYIFLFSRNWNTAVIRDKEY